jgi:hypothetical protein
VESLGDHPCLCQIKRYHRFLLPLPSLSSLPVVIFLGHTDTYRASRDILGDILEGHFVLYTLPMDKHEEKKESITKGHNVTSKQKVH